MHLMINTFLTKGLLEESDKEENVQVTSRIRTFFRPQAGVPVIRNRSTLRTAPDLWENVSLAVLFGSNVNSCSL
jgi:hypothetical protein